MGILSIMRWRPVRIKEEILRCTRNALNAPTDWDRGAFHFRNDHDVQILVRHFDSALLFDRERITNETHFSFAVPVPLQLTSRLSCSRAFKSRTAQVRKYNPIDAVNYLDIIPLYWNARRINIKVHCVNKLCAATNFSRDWRFDSAKCTHFVAISHASTG